MRTLIKRLGKTSKTYALNTAAFGFCVCVAGGLYAQEALDANGFPLSWQAADFAFTMLEPSAGELPVSPSVAPTLPTAAGLALNISRTASPSVPQPQTFTIEQMPRISLTPSGTMALPPARGEGLEQGQGLGRPLSQALPQSLNGARNGGVAADLGIMVNEQPLAGGNELGSLAAYGPLAAGVAAPENAWVQADAATQKTRLVAATSQPLQSLALREAYRRLLLAQITPPAASPNQPHWLAVRAETLENLGWYEAAWSLWRQVGPQLRQPNTPPELMQGWARASLLAGQTDAACALVREQAAAGMVSDFWPNAAAVCAALELQQTGNPATLTLAIQLLPTRTLQQDPALVMALSAVRDAVSPTLGQKGGKQWPVGPLAGAALAAVPESLGQETLPILPDVVLRRLRESPKLAASVRQNAALYLADQTGWVEDAARWLTMASSPTLPFTVGAAWPDAAVVAWAQHPSISIVVNDPSASRVGLEAAAPMVVPAALRLGVPALAQQWWPLWNPLTSKGQQRAQSLLALELQAGKGVSASTVQTWFATKEVDPAANQRVLAVMEGMGQTVSGTLWAAVAGEGSTSDAMDLAWQRLLETAVTQRDTPAVLSMVAEALRGGTPANANPGVLKASLQALRSIGANETAQRLAAEALTLNSKTQSGARLMPLDEERILTRPNTPAQAVQQALPSAAQKLSPVSATIARPLSPASPTSPVAPKPPLLPKPKL